MRNQHGITLIGAIFVLIIVSLLGTYLLSIAGVQRQTSLLALQSARAYQIANAGIEWGISTGCSALAAGASSTTGPFSLNNFSVTVTLTADNNNPYNEEGLVTTICQINSKAEYGSYGQPNYVSRTLEVAINQ